MAPLQKALAPSEIVTQSASPPVKKKKKKKKKKTWASLTQPASPHVKKKEKILVQKCKPNSLTEDFSLRSPNRKLKEKNIKENPRLRQDRESERLFKKKKKKIVRGERLCHCPRRE